MDDMKKLYIEPTSRCNLSCTMCSRNYWEDEQPGDMDYGLFQKVIGEAKETGSIHTVFFGGIGEPLYHPRIIDMVKAAGESGKKVELITNGTLLDEKTASGLIDSGPDRLWISIDSADTAEYADIRRGAEYGTLTGNLAILKRLRREKGSGMRLGLSFVLMKRNAAQLANLTSFARKYHISDVKVTNAVPYSREMLNETLFTRALSMQLYTDAHDVTVDLPLFDMTEEVKEPVYSLLREPANFRLMGEALNRKWDHCRFIHEGNVFVRWDGEACPCMALLHSGKTYLYDWERVTRFASFGSVKNQSLRSIWESREYAAFRDKVKAFDFSPCTVCGGCDRLNANEENCFGDAFPVCGGCLWAQGFIQCP